MAGEIEGLLNELKEKGVGAAVVRTDGVVVYSTLALNDVSSGLISSITSISGSMMEKLGDRQKEIEIVFENATLVMVPGKARIFCAMAKTPEEKTIAIDYAKKSMPYL